MDAGGVEAVRPWVEVARATFLTVVDSENRLASLYGYKLIPNGILLDETGIVRYAKLGGFSIDNATDVAAIQQLLDGEVEWIEPESSVVPYQLGATERELVETRWRLGAELFRRGAREEALTEWRRALWLDPENLTIRKQIWMARYPEKFHPTIDFAWQAEQLQREREEELAAGICGPDGCPIPSAIRH